MIIDQSYTSLLNSVQFDGSSKSRKDLNFTVSIDGTDPGGECRL